MESVDDGNIKTECIDIKLEEITETEGKPGDITPDKKNVSLINYPYYQQPYQQPYQPPYQYPNFGQLAQGYGQYPQYPQQPYFPGSYPYYPPPPPNVSGGGNPYRASYPGQPDETFHYRNSEIFATGFDTVKIRNRFVQRVYTILSVQLFLTFGFIALAVFEPHLREAFVNAVLPIFILGSVLYLGTALVLICVSDLRRRFPINFILLGLLTVAMTLMLTCVSVLATPVLVLYAAGTTALLCFVISLFAIQTKWDVTGCGMFVCVSSIVFMIFGFVLMIMSFFGVYFRLLDIVYCSLGVLLVSFYLMYDTQQIVGGRRIELSPEEYILGALSLYVDMARLFLFILRLYMLCHHDD